MQIKLLLIFLFILGCSGETYDVSRAINILPEKTESFTPNPALKNVSVTLNGNYYSGNLEKIKLVKLSSKFSNFELKEGSVCYVNKSFILRCFDLFSKNETAKIPLIISKTIKTKNINNIALTVFENSAVALTNDGYVIKANIEEKLINWTAKIEDVTTIKPLILANKVYIFTSSGAVKIYDLETGDLLAQSPKQEDQTGINFSSTAKNLSPVPLQNNTIIASYYRNDILFFEAKTSIKIFQFSVNENSLDFNGITYNPIVLGGGMLVPSSSLLSFVSLSSGNKLWSLNANIENGFGVIGNFIFFADRKAKKLVLASVQDASVKWQSELEENNLNKLFLVPASSNELLMFNENGIVTKFNLQNGEEIETVKERFKSKNMDYKLQNGKIFYTESNGTLIMLN